MSEATLILKQFRNRIRQLYVGDVDSESKHDRLSFESVLAFRKLLISFQKMFRQF